MIERLKTAAIVGLGLALEAVQVAMLFRLL